MLASRMMNYPLTVTHLLQRAKTYYPGVEIVSRRTDKTLHRGTYEAFYKRSARLANALARLGVKTGDRVATLCWNHREHLEAYFGVPAMGAVVHTLNLRLHPSEIGYIAKHAEDKVVIVDRSLLPLFEKFADTVPSIKHVIVVPDPASANPVSDKYLDYEELLAAEAEEYDWPHLDETAAAMICYTSGTTGNPKGVVYSHRSTVLHALVAALPDELGVRQADVVLPVVPMFHAAAWGLPFMAVLSGSEIVFPGPHLDPGSLLDLMAAEKITIAGGVPTIWIGILAMLDRDAKKWDLSSVRAMVIGGSAAPATMIDGFSQRHGLEVLHAWGMTETNPLGTVARVKHHLSTKSAEERLAYRASQGFAAPFFEVKHVDDRDQPLPWDGQSMGELLVRGPWVASSYMGDEGEDKFTKDGWFRTGDVVTIDSEGYVRITDRAKDVIKSGGEWISSVALENALMSHPAVLEAAVFAAKHSKWDERPVAAIVVKEGHSVTKEELAEHLASKFAKFWLPDEYLFIAQIPRTSTGKFLKSKLRHEHENILLAK
ncbi:MAG: long-chain fatty acid--CoA ligase [Polyangiaceae bacterium]